MKVVFTWKFRPFEREQCSFSILWDEDLLNIVVPLENLDSKQNWVRLE